MTLHRTITIIAIATTVALFLVLIPAVKVWAQYGEDWMKPTFHKLTPTEAAIKAAADKDAEAQNAASEKAEKEWLANLEKTEKDSPEPSNMTVEEQLTLARQKTMEAEAATRPPCQLKNFTGGVITTEELTERCNTDENILRNMTTIANKTTTVDDGYVYPKNATNEEKEAIDAKEFQAWEEAGRPGS